MKQLHLSGYGVKIRVQGLRSRSELEVFDGREDFEDSEPMRFKPRRFPYTGIIIDGHSGYVSLQALHWLSRNKVPVFVLSYDGSLISTILPPGPVKADLRAAQIRACSDVKMKFEIARSIVQAKVARNLQVLDWLAQRHDIERGIALTRKEAFRLPRADTVVELRTLEGRVALRYWQAFSSVIPECFDFAGRMTTSHQNNASDPVNLALNYAYGVLEGECRRAINAVGLEPSVGFLHEFSDYQTKESLVYDLQEPFRWIADAAVLEAFESGTLDLPDFYFTGDDYRYRIETDARRRLLGLIRYWFNDGVKYNGRILKWDTVIEEKTSELGRFLTGKSFSLDFAKPSPELTRNDDRATRKRILCLSEAEARRRGIGRSTYYSLRRNARSERSFAIYQKTQAKLRGVSR